MTNPLTPDEAQRKHALPDLVIACVNELIVENMSVNGQTWGSSFNQHELIERIAVNMGVKREEVSAKGWLHFETTFSQFGWKIELRPAAGETFPAYYMFRKRRP